jgi:hypothetical protein
MSNTQAICNSFKQEILSGIHALGTTVVRTSTDLDILKAALYLTTASLGAGTTTYSLSGEVSGTNYTAGGALVTNVVHPILSGSTAIWTPSASITWYNVTLSTAFNAVLIYNSQQLSGGFGRAICVNTFGSQTIIAADFVLTMPVNDVSNALIRLS